MKWFMGLKTNKKFKIMENTLFVYLLNFHVYYYYYGVPIFVCSTALLTVTINGLRN
jgi:hypothetical protein